MARTGHLPQMLVDMFAVKEPLRLFSEELILKHCWTYVAMISAFMRRFWDLQLTKMVEAHLSLLPMALRNVSCFDLLYLIVELMGDWLITWSLMALAPPWVIPSSGEPSEMCTSTNLFLLIRLLLVQ